MILAIDTSGRGGAVALADAQGLRTVVRHDATAGYAESLLSLIDLALAEVGADRRELQGVAVARGPGSFTGLRIGVMTAKSMALGLDCPLWAASVPELAAAPLLHSGARSVVVVQDAGRGAVTLSVHRPDTHSEPVRLAQRDVGGWIAARSWESMAVCLVGADPVPVFPVNVEATVRSEVASILAVAVASGRGPAQRVDPVALVPAYVGPSQAERAHGLDLGDEVHRIQPAQPADGPDTGG